MFSSLQKILGKNSDLALVFLTIGVLVILFTPVPPKLLDFLLLLNLSCALLVLLLTFYMEKPVQFSTFPALLLITTLFRLSLNIAATRLILSDADAGRVIGAIGSYVVGGNYVIGLIVFMILVVVQYVVVTSGAQRVAEVAARFTLDSMPGQQMAIDADLNMGFIDQTEAQRRRKNLEKEAHFYGAMDGASKFVKGDAIAGIIILLIDILGGWAIGVMQMKMKWAEALHTYTLLTIGDGIVTQVPALVIALGTGIIVTRSASDPQLSAEVIKQLMSFPKTVWLVVVGLFVMLILPGIPAIPVLALIALFSGFAWYARAFKKTALQDELDGRSDGKAPSGNEDLYDLLTVDPVEIRVGTSLISIAHEGDGLLMERIAAFRKNYVLEAGFVIPKIRIKDDKRLAPSAYEISICGAVAAHGEILVDRILAIHPEGEVRAMQGVETKDPTYGLPAVWILDTQRTEARRLGFTLVDPMTVFVTHLNELLRQHSATLLSRAETERLVENLRKSNAGLVEELIPTVMTLSELQKVLQGLLKEKVSIRNLEAVLEVLADTARQTKDTEYLIELVRQRMGALICQQFSSKAGVISVLTLDPAVESRIGGSIRPINERPTLVLDPQFAEQLLSRLGGQVEKMVRGNAKPILLCAPEIRRHLRRLTERVLPQLSVLSMSEVPSSVSLSAFGVVTL
jgi:flagellar biosynthesis protein FlhA